MTTVLADLVLVLHVAYAAFVVGGLLMVPLGGWLGWHWVRARGFRLAHVICTAVVALEALLGVICPLTWLEHVLLTTSGAPGYDRSFIGSWLYWLLYYDVPAWVFTVAYSALALTVLLLFYRLPPAPKLSRS
jgi:Protein of Unknown function (DUF2784)